MCLLLLEEFLNGFQVFMQTQTTVVGILVYSSTCLWIWNIEAALVFSAFHGPSGFRVGTYRVTTWWADRSPELCSAQLWLSWHAPVTPPPVGQSSEEIQGAGHILQIRSIYHRQLVARDPLLPAHGQPFSLRATKASSLTKMSLTSTALKAADPKPTLSNPWVLEIVPGRAKETAVQAMHADAKFVALLVRELFSPLKIHPKGSF